MLGARLFLAIVLVQGMIPNGKAYRNSAKNLPYNGHQKSFKLIGHMPVLSHARCSTFFVIRFGPRNDSERPGLQKFCKKLAIQWAPNHSICLAIRSKASGQRPNCQTNKVIWCPLYGKIFAEFLKAWPFGIIPWTKTISKKSGAPSVCHRWPVSKQFERFLRHCPK